MLIEIDDSALEDFDLTPDEYIYMYYLMQGIIPRCRFNLTIERLISEGYITNDGAKDELTDKGERVFIDPEFETKLEEFWTTFPHTVPSPKGGAPRVLRTAELNASVGRAVRKKYKKLSKKHDVIMRGLKYQLAHEDIRYLQQIETWLNSRTYEKYSNLEDYSDKSGGIQA